MNIHPRSGNAAGLYLAGQSPIDDLLLRNRVRVFWGLAFFALFALLYGYKLFHFAISIDEEYGFYRTSPMVWIAQGRWGIALVEWLFLPQAAMPVVPIAVYGAFISATLAWASDLFQLRSLSARLVAFALVASFPSTVGIAEFSANLAPTGIALFASLLCAVLSRKTSKSANFGFILILAFATSVYQSALFLVLVLSLGLCVNDTLEGDISRHTLIRRLMRLAASTIAGVVVYGIISKALLSGLHLKAEYILTRGFSWPTQSPSSATFGTTQKICCSADAMTISRKS
jgi:hypothetical protein